MPSSSSSSSSNPSNQTLTLTLTPSPGTLIPGLPDDLTALILASIPYSHHARLRPTSRSWHAFLSPRRIISLRRCLHFPPRHLLCLFPADPAVCPPYLFDPVARAWAPLPPLPCSPNFYGLSNFVLLALGSHIYVLGGSQFDVRDYPLGRPRPSAAVHRLDLSVPTSRLAWSRLPDMLVPRGSFACASVGDGEGIIVAGGGSRHPMFPSDGSRMSSVERFDVQSRVWRVDEGLPKYRAGCIGFFVKQRNETEEEEFWVMGGYGDYRTLSGVVPASVYYRDAVVLGMRSGKWREIGDMWGAGERHKLGLVVTVDGEDGQEPGIYMLDRSEIFRYDFASNLWWKDSSLRRKIHEDEPCGFVAMNGELYVMASPKSDPERILKKRSFLEIQVYNPKKRKWRFLRTNPPFEYPIDFKSAVSCTVRV